MITDEIANYSICWVATVSTSEICLSEEFSEEFRYGLVQDTSSTGNNGGGGKTGNSPMKSANQPPKVQP